jgi:hypothetical protein
VRSRITFLTRLVFLKLLALFTLVLLSLYAPVTTNMLWDGAGVAATALAKGVEGSLQFAGSAFGDIGLPAPRKGAVELTFRYVYMDKVMLFIGITIVLYLAWLVLVGLVLAAVRRRPARLRSVGADGPP